MKIIIKTKTILLAAFLVAFSVTLIAQNNETVTITNSYKPTIDSTAKRIDIKPEIIDTAYPVPNFRYTITNRKLPSPFNYEPVNPAKMGAEPLSKIYSTWVAGGFGNYLTPYFEISHNKTRSKNIRYGAQYKHFSSSGKMENYLNPAFSDNLVELYGTKIMKVNKIDAAVVYKRYMNHFYGLDDSIMFIIDPDISEKDIKQVYNLAKADLKLSKFRLAKNESDYSISAGYYFLGDIFKSMENSIYSEGHVDWKANISPKFDKQRLGLKENIEFFMDKDSILSKNIFHAELVPYYKFEHKSFSASIGAAISISQDTLTNINIFPDITMNLEAIPSILYFNLNLYGGHKMFGLKEMSYENPFVNNIIERNLSRNAFSAAFGMGASVSRYFNVNLKLTYEKWKNSPFYITDSTRLIGNRFIAVYDDYDLVALKVGVSFHMNKKLNFLLNGDYFVYNTYNQLFAWHKPEYEVKLIANYNLADRILVKALLNYYGPMTAAEYSGGDLTPIDIKPWFDGSLGIEYRFRKRLGIFVNLNNLAAQKYMRWYNYPVYGFNFMAGASYIF